jgi:hypothetical protein
MLQKLPFDAVWVVEQQQEFLGVVVLADKQNNR